MFETIVVGTDGSPRAERAVQEAIDLARSEGARLHLVAAFGERERHWEQIQSSREVAVVDLRAVAEHVLERHGQRARDQGVEAVDWSAREGDPAEVILDAADAEGADAIVVGNKGINGRRRFLLGSVPERIARHAGRTVIIVDTGD